MSTCSPVRCGICLQGNNSIPVKYKLSNKENILMLTEVAAWPSGYEFIIEISAKINFGKSISAGLLESLSASGLTFLLAYI
jgi:hypothetical protein